ncbi:primosomal protein N' [Actinoalloteichus hymeniacidonis]|uniref:Probable replication restart protein PriA n=1 Tax=Actinoalloteichus hymeniacidonis TaxID=340345 RepID=A0AAC9HRE7_9PSEU|nr:primosomal protein N' [Actinoalloteichus hymeniacidonis]AOS63125.1 replication restart DNA helicase PriA [Actinoalloteichus hymeniacidonis]MBB5908839.1 primosomal protein N' (replication factor Y) [Actinoalloteichus hymeniacidonis]
MARSTTPRRGEWQQASVASVARVCVNVSPAHLDRVFDYRVPAHLDEQAQPGVRVRLRFAGRLVDGFLLERVAETDFDGTLQWIDKVVSPEPVLSPEVAQLARAVADRYAGTLMDVLRLAIPPRHAAVEKEAARAAEPSPPERERAEQAIAAGAVPSLEEPSPAAPERHPEATQTQTEATQTQADQPQTIQTEAPDPGGWRRYQHGDRLLAALHAGKAARAVWQPLPGEDWPARLAEAAASVAATGRGVVIVLPDQRDVARVAAACTRLCEAEQVVALSAGLGPAKRYRRWLAIRRGTARIVVGTRSAAFAPVERPGLLVVWDDGDDVHSDPHAPYPHTREVLMLRSHLTGAGLIIAGFPRTAEAQLLVETRWAQEVIAERSVVRAAAPRVVAVGASAEQEARDPAARSARLPGIAFEAARAALAAEAPVLVQVPRRGYVPTLACGQCRSRARCRRCAGPLALPGSDDRVPRPAACRWCGATEAGFRCPDCGSRRLRAVVVGAGRTAEELGRAFPGVVVRTSGGSEVLDEIPAGPALVVCTPGAEPLAPTGYGAALLLDGWALLGRPDLRAEEEALRRWLSAAAMVRPAEQGGRVVVMAESSLNPVQALVWWDPVRHAVVELAGRRELGFPPVARMAALDAVPAAIEQIRELLRLPEGAELLGPVPLPSGAAAQPGSGARSEPQARERLLVRAPLSQGRALSAAVAEAIAVRTARREAEPIRVHIDPLDLV